MLVSWLVTCMLVSGLRLNANCPVGTVCCVADLYNVLCLNHGLCHGLIKLIGSVTLVHQSISIFGAFIYFSVIFRSRVVYLCFQPFLIPVHD